MLADVIGGLALRCLLAANSLVGLAGREDLWLHPAVRRHKVLADAIIKPALLCRSVLAA